MKIGATVGKFSQLLCTDAYTDDFLFRGQIHLSDDSIRDAVVVERRVLEVAPTVSPPSRRAVTAGGIVWLMGTYTPDFWRSEAIRHKYTIHQADGLANLKTIAQALVGSAGTQAYASLFYTKGTKEVATSSAIFDQFTAYTAQGEPVSERTLFFLNGRWSLTRTVFDVASGLQAATVDELPEPVVETATLNTRTLVPATDAYTTATASVTVLRVRWQSAFEYLSKASETYERGDMQCMLPRATAPKTNDTLTLSDGTWRVLSVIDEGAYWSAHLRHA